MRTGDLNAEPTLAFDWTLFGCMVAVLVLSSLVFWSTIRHETHHRAQHRLSEWAHRNRFARMNNEFGVPRPLDRVAGVPLSLTIGLYNRNTRLVHVRAAAPTPDAAPTHWNLAIRRVASPSPPVGLRAAEAETGRSIVDLFALETAPHQPAAARFTVVGEDVVASRKLAAGSGRALLPADLSLLRIDEYLVIDFSSRPFDEIELGRMLAMLDQLASVV